MSDTPKIYENTIIEDNPFPQDVEENQTVSDSSKGGVYGATEIVEKPFPAIRYAQELISKTLNTVSNKIMGAYEFTQHGAIQIGKYVFGVSGEIKISPDGVVAKNKEGDTTFALDGTTGDATFRGTLKAGTLIAGDDSVLVDQNSEGNGRILLFNDGVPQILIGDPNE